MSRTTKLRALQKRCELNEQEALTEKSTIDLVVEQRHGIVDQFIRERDALKTRLEQLRGKGRTTALRNSDVADARSITGYVRRLRNDIAELDKVIQVRQEELTQALQRAQLAEGELQEAIMERRRVEKVIERLLIEERVEEAGREEVSLDDTAGAAKRGNR